MSLFKRTTIRGVLADRVKVAQRINTIRDKAEILASFAENELVTAEEAAVKATALLDEVMKL